MLKRRVIPVLLLRGGGLVKTVKFRDARYLGDPINAVRIFNEKEVDELVFLDIGATPNGVGPNFELLSNIVNEAFMPFGYGGGISTLEQVQRLLEMGIEKVVINTAVASSMRLVEEAARLAGSQSVVGVVDVGRNRLGRTSVYVRGGREDLNVDPVARAQSLAAAGAGEILLNSIERDGTQQGYDGKLIRRVSDAVSVPVVAVGGAGRIEDLKEAVEHGASAVAAGSLFVLQGKHRAVLITYPAQTVLQGLFLDS